MKMNLNDIQPKASQTIATIEMHTIIKLASTRIQHIEIEMKENIKEGKHTTKAYEKIKNTKTLEIYLQKLIS